MAEATSRSTAGLAQLAYDGYRRWVDERDPGRAPLPIWQLLPVSVQQAWITDTKHLRAHRPPERELDASGGGYVYFIGSGTEDPIKIGSSGQPAVRLRTLQTDSPSQLKVLGVIRTTGPAADEERRLHRLFAHLRLQGEWFSPGADLLLFIATSAHEYDIRRHRIIA